MQTKRRRSKGIPVESVSRDGIREDFENSMKSLRSRTQTRGFRISFYIILIFGNKEELWKTEKGILVFY